nr:DUF429 domain-containing protein [uncultured Halomonas sp.]
MTGLAFNRLLHADWSRTPGKRWVTEARWDDAKQRWQVSASHRVGNIDAWLKTFLDDESSTTLVGFDFPLGVPASWAHQVGIDDFGGFLDQLAAGQWPDFFRVAQTPQDIVLARPFYPNRSCRGMRQTELTNALGVAEFDDLRRECERRTPGRLPCPLFWTLGANQVGKAAIAGWREVIIPTRVQACMCGAALWPFDGDLAFLAARSRCVLCETWPTLATHLLGVGMGAGQSKRRQADRIQKGRQLLADTQSVIWDSAAKKQLTDGFGTSASGEDPFDALLGLLMMIEIADGRLAAAPNLTSSQRNLEGWILGLDNSGD